MSIIEQLFCAPGKHLKTEKNTYRYGKCKSRQLESIRSKGPKVTRCYNGHLRIPENLYKNNWCKLCEKDRAKTLKQREKHSGFVRNYQLKKDFGITLAEYNEMFKIQEGKCSICKIHQSNCKKELAVDHNHITGKVRKLLCSRCNVGLGIFKEDTILLNNVIRYIEENNGK